MDPSETGTKLKVPASWTHSPDPCTPASLLRSMRAFKGHLTRNINTLEATVQHERDLGPLECLIGKLENGIDEVDTRIRAIDAAYVKLCELDPANTDQYLDDAAAEVTRANTIISAAWHALQHCVDARRAAQTGGQPTERN